MLNPTVVEEVDELRAQLRQLPLRETLHQAGPRHRRVTCLNDKLHATVRWQPRRCTPENIRILSHESRERRVVGAAEAELRVGQAKRREMQLGTIPQDLDAVPAAAGERWCRAGRRSVPSAGVSRLTPRRFKSGDRLFTRAVFALQRR